MESPCENEEDYASLPTFCFCRLLSALPSSPREIPSSQIAIPHNRSLVVYTVIEHCRATLLSTKTNLQCCVGDFINKSLYLFIYLLLLF